VLFKSCVFGKCDLGVPRPLVIWPNRSILGCWISHIE